MHGNMNISFSSIILFFISLFRAYTLRSSFILTSLPFSVLEIYQKMLKPIDHSPQHTLTVTQTHTHEYTHKSSILHLRLSR
jgi:hypothetical protein